jgi:glutamate--cysteine ligase
LVDSLSFEQRMDLWHRARVHGLTDPEVLEKCQRLLEYARMGLDRLDVRDSKGRTEARFLDALDDQVARKETPAGEALAKLGDDPSRGAAWRRAVAEHFLFAGKLG